MTHWRTLLQRMKTSPSEPTDSPSWYSSVFASCARGHRRVSAYGLGQGGAEGSGADLEVHVVVGRDEVALVLHPPLEAHEDGLAGEVREEGLGVDGLVCGSGQVVVRASRRLREMGGGGEEEASEGGATKGRVSAGRACLA